MNLLDHIAAASRKGKSPFVLDVGHEHLRGTSALPPELAIFEKNFKFTPVDEDPFEDPKDKAEREAKEREAAQRAKT